MRRQRTQGNPGRASNNSRAQTPSPALHGADTHRDVSVRAPSDSAYSTIRSTHSEKNLGALNDGDVHLDIDMQRSVSHSNLVAAALAKIGESTGTSGHFTPLAPTPCYPSSGALPPSTTESLGEVAEFAGAAHGPGVTVADQTLRQERARADAAGFVRQEQVSGNIFEEHVDGFPPTRPEPALYHQRREEPHPNTTKRQRQPPPHPSLRTLWQEEGGGSSSQLPRLQHNGDVPTNQARMSSPGGTGLQDNFDAPTNQARISSPGGTGFS